MKNLTASIVVYKNDINMLDEAIKSCIQGLSNLQLHVIDNSPTNEASVLQNKYDFKYSFNNKNLGFGKAHNLVLKEIINSSDYHIIVNPDVFFEPDVIPKLYNYMEANKDVGVIMPKVLYPNGQLQYLCKLLPKPHNLVYRRFFKLIGKKLDKCNHSYEMRFTGYDKIMDVPFVSGCFMFVRTEALKKIGLFDERIFLYTEDVDLSRRINRHFKTKFFPEAVIYHHHNRQSYKDMRTLWHHIESAVNYFNKWGWFVDKERDAINNKVLQQSYVIDETQG